jgi:hypothetical protein
MSPDGYLWRPSDRRNRRVTALESEGNKRAPRPSSLCRPRERRLVIEPFTVAEKRLQILNGV